MRHRILMLALAAGCSAPPEAAQPDELAFASAYLRAGTEQVPAEEPSQPNAVPASRPKRGPRDEIRGLLEIDPQRRAELARIAGDDKALSGFLAQPVTASEFEALAWMRSPDVRAAREQVEAVRTGYAQSADLRDLAALYRSFLRTTDTRVGPEHSRRATATIAPSPNVDALSGLLVDAAVDIAFEELRRVVAHLVADAERAHADAARLAAARRVLRDDVALHESLLEVLRVRVETGRSAQAALLTFQARLESLRTELAVLVAQEAAVRAQWNRLLHRPEDGALNLDVTAADHGPQAPLPEAGVVHALALEENPMLRIASLRVERQAIAVRLAETMTLPRMDVGSSRFERERAGEAGVQRGAVFPEPGRMNPPRWDFGVREAQLGEMRARQRAALDARAATRADTEAGARVALFALDSARRRWRLHGEELVPLAEQSLETTRGSYEGNEAGYLELLESARELLRARLGLVDSRRAYSHARAGLLEVVGVRTSWKRDQK